MKLPRDISAKDLAKALHTLGYETSRQTGSHIRLTTETGGTHHITIPNHNPIKSGTLTSILRDISQHHGMNSNGSGPCFRTTRVCMVASFSRKMDQTPTRERLPIDGATVRMSPAR